VPYGVPDLLNGHPSLASQGRHLLKRPFQVPVNVIGQGLEGRDVEAVDALRQLAPLRQRKELTDDGDEGRKGLARAGGRADESISSLLNEGHSLPLGRCEEPFLC